MGQQHASGQYEAADLVVVTTVCLHTGCGGVVVCRPAAGLYCCHKIHRISWLYGHELSDLFLNTVAQDVQRSW
jgi:hypothetical protein